MPRRKKILKKAKSVISENIKKYLLTGERAPGDAETFVLQRGGSQLKAIWKAVNRELLNDWIKQNPCSRPWAWWAHDAPRWINDPFEGCYYHGTIAEPRQRLGGTGTPSHEVLAIKPSFTKGIPESWIDKTFKKIGFKGKAIDPNDPPVFESEAAYLKRHGLLTMSEQRHLEKNLALLEPETLQID